MNLFNKIRFISENIYLNPGDEYIYNIFTGDTLILQCPMNSSLTKKQVRWSYMESTGESILSIGEKLNEELKDFRFSVGFTNHIKNVSFLRIYNITSKEPKIYRCYYYAAAERTSFNYKYSIRLASKS